MYSHSASGIIDCLDTVHKPRDFRLETLLRQAWFLAKNERKLWNYQEVRDTSGLSQTIQIIGTDGNAEQLKIEKELVLVIYQMFEITE